jgi:hypothetical protein
MQAGENLVVSGGKAHGQSQVVLAVLRVVVQAQLELARRCGNPGAGYQLDIRRIRHAHQTAEARQVNGGCRAIIRLSRPRGAVRRERLPPAGDGRLDIRPRAAAGDTISSKD